MAEEAPEKRDRPKMGLAFAGFVSAVTSYALAFLYSPLVHFNPVLFFGSTLGPYIGAAFFLLPPLLFLGGMIVCLVYIIRRIRKRTTEGGLGFAIAGLAITLLPLLLVTTLLILEYYYLI